MVLLIKIQCLYKPVYSYLARMIFINLDLHQKRGWNLKLYRSKIKLNSSKELFWTILKMVIFKTIIIYYLKITITTLLSCFLSHPCSQSNSCFGQCHGLSALSKSKFCSSAQTPTNCRLDLCTNMIYIVIFSFILAANQTSKEV